jgi:hypothetical protein
MLLKKTKLAGIISLVLCTTAVASTTAIVVDSSGEHDFGPYVSAMNTSSAATSTQIPTSATYTQKYAQQFSYDIGAPWTYNEYCVYDSDVCTMFWNGSKKDNSDGLYVWRSNILNTDNNFNGTYESDTTSSVNTTDVPPTILPESRRITALDGDVEVGYGTVSGKITRRGYYDTTQLEPEFMKRGGFSSAFDAATVTVAKSSDSSITFKKKLIVGQASVRWSSTNESGRFDRCFNSAISDRRTDYDELYNCPGFDLQASYWDGDGDDKSVKPSYLTSKTNWLGTGNDANFIANAYAINTSGFAVGFSTQQIYSSISGGRARATIFKPTVESAYALSYEMTEITKPKTDSGGDYNDIIRDTVAVDITDKVYVSANSPFVAADGTDSGNQGFIIVGNRTYDQSQNRSYATEFYTYNVKTKETRYPFQAKPIKGANSQVSKINNDGIVVGWRDARGETSPTVAGSPRFQSAFIYDYKTKKSAYLDDLYCQGIDDSDVKYRFVNAISISDPDASGNVVVVSNALDFKNLDNYQNRVGSTNVVLSMTITEDELTKLSSASQCPIKVDEDYRRKGASMNWFILLPTMLLLFRRFKR